MSSYANISSSILIWERTWYPGFTTTNTLTQYASPTFDRPYTSCEVILKPAWVRWVEPTSFAYAGTSYIYIDPVVNTTSTTLTCTPSLVPTMRGISDFKLAMQISMDDNCNLHATYPGPLSRGTVDWTATWPGPSTILDIGSDLFIRYFWSQSYAEWQTYLPEGSQQYNGTMTPISVHSSMEWIMPRLSEMYPELTDLKTCTSVIFETSPNSMTKANFLTQIITLPRTNIGQLTQIAGPQQTPAPIPRPNLSPTTSGSSTVPTKPAENVEAAPVNPAAQPGRPQPPSDSSAGQEASSEDDPVSSSASDGDTDSGIAGPGSRPKSASPSRMIEIPALVLGPKETLRPDSPAMTRSGYTIRLDSQGSAIVIPVMTAGEMPTQNSMIKVTRDQIIRDGGILVSGIKIAAFATALREEIVEEQNDGDTGSRVQEGNDASGGSASTGGGSIGQRIASISAWIASGLNSLAGSLRSDGTGNMASAPGMAESPIGQHRGGGRNTTIQPFTGAAARGNLRYGTLAVIGMMLLVIVL